MNRLDRMKAAMAVAAITTASAGLAEAISIGINFRGSGYGAPGANVTADAYGVALANWTNSPDSETGTNFTANGLSVTWTATNDWSQGITVTPGEGEVNSGYIDDTGDTQSVTISGLVAWMLSNSATSYTIQLIQASDNSTGFTNTDLFVSNGGASLGTLTNSGNNPGGDAFASPTSISALLTSDTLYINPQPRLDVGGSINRGTIAGIIITSIPEPSTVALLGMAGLGLLRRRRN